MNRESDLARDRSLRTRSDTWVGLDIDRLSPLALPTSYGRHFSAATHYKVSMFCIPKTSLLLIGLAISPSTCRTTEESEDLSVASQELEVETLCADLDTASCKDSVRVEFELQSAQDLSDD